MQRFAVGRIEIADAEQPRGNELDRRGLPRHIFPLGMTCPRTRIRESRTDGFKGGSLWRLNQSLHPYTLLDT